MGGSEGCGPLPNPATRAALSPPGPLSQLLAQAAGTSQPATGHAEVGVGGMSQGGVSDGALCENLLAEGFGAEGQSQAERGCTPANTPACTPASAGASQWSEAERAGASQGAEGPSQEGGPRLGAINYGAPPASATARVGLPTGRAADEESFWSGGATQPAAAGAAQSQGGSQGPSQGLSQARWAGGDGGDERYSYSFGGEPEEGSGGACVGPDGCMLADETCEVRVPRLMELWRRGVEAAGGAGEGGWADADGRVGRDPFHEAHEYAEMLELMLLGALGAHGVRSVSVSAAQGTVEIAVDIVSRRG